MTTKSIPILLLSCIYFSGMSKAITLTLNFKVEILSIFYLPVNHQITMKQFKILVAIYIFIVRCVHVSKNT